MKWLKRRTKKAMERRVKINENIRKIRRERRKRERTTITYQTYTRTTSLECRSMSVPEELNLSQNWHDTVQLINDIRQSVTHTIQEDLSAKNRHERRALKSKRNIIQSYFDFSSVRRMSLPVAMMIASEYDRLKTLSKYAPSVINIDKWNPEVAYLLSVCGFFELCGIEQTNSRIGKIGRHTLFRMRRMEQASGADIDQILREIGIDTENGDNSVYDALMEAVFNANEHAYPNFDASEKTKLRSWWVIALKSEKDDGAITLQFVIYDHGATIPSTIPTWEAYPAYKRAYNRFIRLVSANKSREFSLNDRYDGTTISIAMTVGKTRTGKQGRGKGLYKLLLPLQLANNGTLIISSRCGYVKVRHGEGKEIENHSRAINGTLISWTFDWSKK